MTNPDDIEVQVVRALVDSCWSRQVRVPAGATVKQVLQLSGACAADDVVVHPSHLAIFGRVVTEATTVREGDRVEILRPLIADAKQARRERAGNGK